MSSIFSHACCPSGSLFWRNVCLGLLPVFDWVVFLYRAIKPVYFRYQSFANTSILQVVFSFCLWFPLLCKNFLIRSHFLIFVFIVITLSGGSGEILLWFMSESVWAVFSSNKSFVVSGLPFRYLVHFAFIFVCCVRECSYFILLTCSHPVFPAPFIEETVFSPLYIIASFFIDQLTIGFWVYFWAFYPALLFCISGFVPVPYHFDDCSFVVYSEVRKPNSSSSVFLSQDCFGRLEF